MVSNLSFKNNDALYNEGKLIEKRLKKLQKGMYPGQK